MPKFRGLFLARPTARFSASAGALALLCISFGKAESNVNNGHSRQLDIVTDAVLVTENHALILDGRAAELLLITSTHEVIARAGRRGSGPREFRHPQALVKHSDTLVGVVDPANARLSWIRVFNDSLVFRNSFSIPASATSACAIGALVFVAASDAVERTRLTVYGVEGVRRYAFAPLLESPQIEAERQRWSVVGCDLRARQVLLAEQAGANVVAFDLVGKPLWSLAIPGFKLQKIQPTDDGGLAYLTPSGGFHFVRAVRPLPDGRMGISANRTWPRAEEDTATQVATIFSFSSNGQSVRARDRVELLLDVRGSIGLWYLENPEPKLLFAQWDDNF